jgi:hypothetical protein
MSHRLRASLLAASPARARTRVEQLRNRTKPFLLALAAEYDGIGMRRGEAVEAFRQQDVDGIDELSHGPIPSVSDLN